MLYIRVYTTIHYQPGSMAGPQPRPPPPGTWIVLYIHVYTTIHYQPGSMAGPPEPGLTGR